MILIDAGILSDHTFLEQLRTKGYLSQIALVILAHGHYDHIGHAATFQNHFYIPVAIHRGDLEKVTRGIMDFPPARGFISNAIRKYQLSGMDVLYVGTRKLIKRRELEKYICREIII